MIVITGCSVAPKATYIAASVDKGPLCQTAWRPIVYRATDHLETKKQIQSSNYTRWVLCKDLKENNAAEARGFKK